MKFNIDVNDIITSKVGILYLLLLAGYTWYNFTYHYKQFRALFYNIVKLYGEFH